MLILLVLFLIAGFGIAYSVSSAFQARRKADATVRRLHTLFRGLEEAHSQSTEQEKRAAQIYASEVRHLRLKAIKVEELKCHASGLRLSALRSAGIDNLSQLEGWGSQRFMQVRGIGPDSAHRMASLVESISHQSNQLPIPHPVEGPMTTAGYKVMEAIYLDIQTQTTFRDPKAKLQVILKDFQARQASVRARTGFFVWFPGFGTKPALQEAISEAAAMESDLQHTHPASDLDRGLTNDLSRFAGMRRNGVDPNIVDQDVRAHPDWYGAALNALLGQRPSAAQLALGLGRYQASTPVAPSRRESSNVHPSPVEGSPLNISIRMDASPSLMNPSTSEPRERPMSDQADDFWKGPGTNPTVAGFTVPGGMVYVGSGLASVRGSEIEPALINPRRKIQKEGVQVSGHQLPYWPSFETGSPESRGAYLTWLSGGKCHPEADAGFVFLYFYGLERRLLHDLAGKPKVEAEVAAIEDEVRRLASIYGKSGSFAFYTSSLLDYQLAKRIHENPKAPTSVPVITNQYAPNLEVKAGLAWYATKRIPLPPEWAFAWLQIDTNTRPRTVWKRCPNEFAAQFTVEYRKRFGDGILIPENKTRLKVHHRPASPSFNYGYLEVLLDLPDVTVLTGPLNKLHEVAEACYSQLESYSRFIGKNPEGASTLEGLLLLPPTLWPDIVRNELVKLQEQVVTSEGIHTVPYLDLQLRLPEGGDLNKNKFGALSRALGSLGLGIEPDPRFGGALPELNDTIALFTAEGLDQDRPLSQGFVFASLAVHLAAVVAHADGDFGDQEEAILTNHLATWLHLPDQERRRLAARMHLMRQSKPNLTGLQKRIDVLNTDQKMALADLLVLVVHADGVVAPAEVKALERIFEMLGQKAGTVYSKLHGTASEPITVRQAGQEETGFKLPPKPVKPKLAVSGMALDMAKVAALQAESAKISDLLGAIFKEEDQAPAPVPHMDTQELQDEPTLLGLDPDHAGLLQTLMARPQWSRAELEDICSERGMMVDGALERINEAALDAFDEPLIEGEDPLELHRDRLLDRTA